MNKSRLHLVRNLITLFILLGISKKPFSQNCLLADAGPNKQICPSGGSVTIGTPTVSGATYFWSPSTGLSNTSTAQPTASPTTTTTYTLTVTSGQNLLSNGNFETGYTGFNTDYAIFPNSDGSCPPSQNSFGSISVNTNPMSLNAQWCNMTDHSPLGTNMLTVDGSAFPNRRVWFATVPVTPNNTYSFSGWVTNNAPTTDPSETPMLRFRINGAVVLQNYLVPYLQCQSWSQFSMNWFSGASTTVLIEIFDDNLSCFHNDFNLDDLSLTNCPASTDQVTVCVCTPPPPPETVTVQIILGEVVQLLKYNTTYGFYCYSPFSKHWHIQYFNNCNGYSGLLSGYLAADNNLPSSQAFAIGFLLNPKIGIPPYLDFPQNNLALYQPCTESDVIDVTLKFFHKTGTYPLCNPQLGYISEYNLTQPHSGNNSFTIKRVKEPNLMWNYCYSHNTSVYNIDNLPQTFLDNINVPSNSPTADYSIDITQMVKNSLHNPIVPLDFLIQQVQNLSYNNIYFEGSINSNNDIPDPGEPYIELTYIRRGLATNCSVAKPALIEDNLSKVNYLGQNIYDTINSRKNLTDYTKVIPNPANTQITISSPDKINSLEIYGTAGILLKQINVQNLKNITLQVSDLKPGYYFAKLRTDNGIKHIKFAVQR